LVIRFAKAERQQPMIKTVAQPLVAGTPIIGGIGLAFQQYMAAKAAEFSLAAKAIHAGTWCCDVNHRFPKGAPDIKADRGRQVARVNRKTIRRVSA